MPPTLSDFRLFTNDLKHKNKTIKTARNKIIVETAESQTKENHSH